MISDYFRIVEFRLIDAEIIADKKVSYSEFSPDQGMLRGRLLFIDGSTLEFMEYLHRDQRLKYRFHLIDKNGQMVFRYDNAPHHENSTFPHHKHIANDILESEERGILDILREIEHLICKCLSVCSLPKHLTMDYRGHKAVWMPE